MSSITKEELDDLAKVIADSISRMGLTAHQVGVRENSAVNKGEPKLQRNLTGVGQYEAYYMGHDRIDCEALVMLINHLVMREKEAELVRRI